VVKIFEAGFFADLVLEFVDRAGGLDGFDQSALGADQVILVAAGHEQGEVGSPFVKTQAPHDPFFGEPLEQAEDGSLVALLGESLGTREFTERHGSLGLKQRGNELFECFGAPHTEFSAAVDGFRDD